MVKLDFESSLELRQISNDVFENLHRPWTWWDMGIIPGGLLMSESAVAARKTVPSDFILHQLQTHFTNGADSELSITYKVQRVNDGRRFAVRIVIAEQEGKTITSNTISFVSGKAWNGPAMNHSVSRRVKENVERILLNDLATNVTEFGPFMEFERLPIQREGNPKTAQSSIAHCVAKINTPIKASPGSLAHILGIINLSDYHVGDAPLQLSALPFGMPEIGDKSRTPLAMSQKIYTSLNHSIHFHLLDGFRADELTYIEATSPWSKDGRSMVHTRIFTKDGALIATCIQETFTILRETTKPPIGGKL